MNVAFIPVRGGSKSIPLKNIKIIDGQPLVYWVTKAACDCPYINRVYVSTDSCQISEAVNQFLTRDPVMMSKTELIGRTQHSASDTASTEESLLDFANDHCFDSVVLIQATSPLLTAGDLSGGFKKFELPETDSVVSVVRQRRFVWCERAGTAIPINYDPKRRPRRQEFSGFLVENGAFYISSRIALLRSHSRISGNIRTYEMPDDTYIEIDEPSDWDVVELLHKRSNRFLESLTAR